MKVLSAFEIGIVLREMQELVDGKVDQIYQPDNSEIVIAIHKTGIGKKLIRIIPGKALYISDKKRPNPKTVINFCKFLRKRINKSRLRNIEQVNFERIVEFTFETKEEEFILVAEFFSKGNIILLKEDFTILSALQVQLWKDRKIKAREVYKYPPSTDVNMWDIKEDTFSLHFGKSDKENIVKTLAIDFSLGGELAEEVCFKSKVDKNKDMPSAKEVLKLFSAWDEIRNEDVKANINDIPYPIIFKTKKTNKMYKTFNDALNEYYGKDIEEEKEKVVETKLDKKKKEWLTIKRSQEKQLEAIRKSIEENTKKGDKTYEHYTRIKEVLDTIEDARNKNISWKEIEEKLKTEGIIVNAKEKKVTLNLK